MVSSSFLVSDDVIIIGSVSVHFETDYHFEQCLKN